MATLPFKNFNKFVADMTAAWAAQLGLEPVFISGDPLLAMMQSVAAQFVFLQAQIQIVNAVSRAQTSSGADLDTFYGQFGFVRLPGTLASGTENFIKFIPAASTISIPAATLVDGVYVGGTIVQTPGGAIQYRVIPDKTNPNYSTPANAYLLHVGQTVVGVKIQCLFAGDQYDVSGGQLSQLASSIAGIDQVTNPDPIDNGIPQETDAAFSERFLFWLNSLSKAIYAAIVAAIEGVQASIRWNLLENVDVAGNPRPGEFVAVIDDGSGDPPASLIAAVQDAIDAVRGFTIKAEAIAVNPRNVTISMAVRVSAGANALTVEAAVQNAVAAGVNSTPIGVPLYVSAVDEMALTAAGVDAVQPGTTLNGNNADVAITGFRTARTTIGDITVSTY